MASSQPHSMEVDVSVVGMDRLKEVVPILAEVWDARKVAETRLHNLDAMNSNDWLKAIDMSEKLARNAISYARQREWLLDVAALATLTVSYMDKAVAEGRA